MRTCTIGEERRDSLPRPETGILILIFIYTYIICNIIYYTGTTNHIILA